MSVNATEILYGIHPVLEALRAGRRRIFKIYIARDKITKRLGKVVDVAESKKVPIKKITAAQLELMAGIDQHQGIGARADAYPLKRVADIMPAPESADANFFLLLLDNIKDPHNLGALVRTALCVGINGIVIPKDRSASPTPAVSKASAGALEHVAMARVTNMVNTVKDLKAKGLWIIGLDIASDRSVFSGDLTGAIALVIGGEEKGIRPLVKKHCDFLLSIPQSRRINSLNASAAGAVVMYEAFRQRSLRK
ncbi:MAG: 23S rRNA (guanosine(2251)-2'-O)-methyltransferase RlmB [Proteobacteria bacterium]|nr:23S rRNA (guanosine(2251)-2'-O)-methyltransferase RlmB [Pseudomonadota bacterium]